jgi:excisionase family DNA binding protein
MRALWFISALTAVIAFSAVTYSVAQDSLPDYAPPLPEAKARAWVVDPQKGYLVRQIKPDVFLATDGGYQALFATTGKGVVLFDAPPSFAPHIVQAVTDVTSEPIVMLVYSHIHVDHIGGAGLILKMRAGSLPAASCRNTDVDLASKARIPSWASQSFEQGEPSRPSPAVPRGSLQSAGTSTACTVPSCVTRLLTVAETATALRLSTKTIRRKIDRGELRHVRIGRLVRIRAEVRLVPPRRRRGRRRRLASASCWPGGRCRKIQATVWR